MVIFIIVNHGKERCCMDMKEPECCYCGNKEDILVSRKKASDGMVFSCKDRIDCIRRLCSSLKVNHVDSISEPRPAMYVIINGSCSGMYWSGVNGWVSLDHADRYMLDEVASYMLPEYGKWAAM